jgi:glycogen synthase
MMPIGNNRISVVVNTMQRHDHLEVLLASLERQRFTDFELIIVIGPDSEPSVKVCEKYVGRLALYRCNEANLSMSRNIGLDRANGDLIAFIDDDAIPEPNWLERINKAFAAEDVGVCPPSAPMEQFSVIA